MNPVGKSIKSFFTWCLRLFFVSLAGFLVLAYTDHTTAGTLMLLALPVYFVVSTLWAGARLIISMLGWK